MLLEKQSLLTKKRRPPVIVRDKKDRLAPASRERHSWGLTNEGNRRPAKRAKPRRRGVRVDREVRAHSTDQPRVIRRATRQFHAHSTRKEVPRRHTESLRRQAGLRLDQVRFAQLQCHGCVAVTHGHRRTVAEENSDRARLPGGDIAPQLFDFPLPPQRRPAAVAGNRHWSSRLRRGKWRYIQDRNFVRPQTRDLRQQQPPSHNTVGRRVGSNYCSCEP